MVAFRRLIEQTELRLSGLRLRLPGGRNDADYVAGRRPVYLVTWTNTVLLRDRFRQGDLVLGCDLRHPDLPFPYYSKERILVQAVGGGSVPHPRGGVVPQC